MLYFLIGFMGAGKTTAGKMLADELGVSFIDSDEAIEEKENSSVKEIFRQRGEAYFRKLEEKFIDGLSSQNGVISCGGGLPCYNSLSDKLLKKGTVIYLRAEVKMLAERLEHERSERPLLAGEDLTTFIETRLSERAVCYGKATITISTDGLTPEETVQKIISEL